MPRRDKVKYNEYMKEYMLRRYQERRVKALEDLGGKCAKCGSKDDLEFHHIDPNTKSFTVGQGGSFSDKRWQEELDKCQLLCEACHIQEHNSKYPCGTRQRYWRGCRCIECRKANAEHSKVYKRLRSLKRETS